MTTDTQLVAEVDDRPSQQIARRVRGLLGENQISGRRMANALGMTTSTFHRRYTGEQPWSTDELGTISALLRVPFRELCAIRDSNPEPADSEPRQPRLTVHGGGRPATVVRLDGWRERVVDVVAARPTFELVQGEAS